MNTRGDNLFEAFCSRRGLDCRRIPEASTQTPDYELVVNGQLLLAEVKTLEPNEEEHIAVARQARGEVVVLGSTPGERLRREIHSANTQLKVQVAGRSIPTLLVVFNNTPCRLHTDPYAVMTAMQGLDVIDVYVAPDPATSPTFGQTHSGRLGRAMRPDANTSTSVLAVLRDSAPGDFGDLHLDIYHNRYAAVPLDPEVMRIAGVSHYCLPDSVSSSIDARWTKV